MIINIYSAFRHFVISSLAKLEVLDGTIITDKERKEAMKVYGKRRIKSKKDHMNSNRTL